MPPGPVTAAAADERVVPETVAHSVATGALDVLVQERDAQPSAQHGNKQHRLVVQLSDLARRSVQPKASTTGRDKAEVSAANRGGGGQQLSRSAGIDRLGQDLLGQLAQGAHRETPVVVDSAVVGVKREAFW